MLPKVYFAYYGIVAFHTDPLNGQYSIFGKLISGYETLDAIVTTPAPGSRPSQDQVILSTTVLFVPASK